MITRMERIDEIVAAVDKAWQRAEAAPERSSMIRRQAIKRLSINLQIMEAEDGQNPLLNPRGHYVYLLWGRIPDRPLYVGVSSNLMARLGQHFRDERLSKRFRHVLLEEFGSRELAATRELELIHKYNPPFNVVGRKRPRKAVVAATERKRGGYKQIQRAAWRIEAAKALAEYDRDHPDDAEEVLPGWDPFIDDDDDDDFEFLPGWCPLCGSHHRPDPCEKKETP